VTVCTSSPLDEVRAAVARGPALCGLDPSTYARHHAGFEARSDQRGLLTALLAGRLQRRAGGPVSVLSVGCGDGSVDVVLAATLLGGGGAVRYVGVEPFAGSAGLFAARMAALGPGVDAEVHVATAQGAPLGAETFDVVLVVHSMYYVPDPTAALRAAWDRLRPGGELLVATAPRGALNQLVAAVAPDVDGHPQWFSDDVAAAFTAARVRLADTCTVDAVLDLTGADTDVLDFTVQARLTGEVRLAALAHLATSALPERTPGDLLLPHPVDVHRAVRPASSPVVGSPA
jgi:SAM-dependent methyltransferase